MNHYCTSKLTLTLSRHFRQDVALVSTLALITTGRHLKPLSGTAVNFGFLCKFYTASARFIRCCTTTVLDFAGVSPEIAVPAELAAKGQFVETCPPEVTKMYTKIWTNLMK